MANALTSEEIQEYNKNNVSQGNLLRELIMGFRTTQIIATAAKLNLAAHLKNGPQSAAQLAAATRTDEERLYRLLRALASLGILETRHDATFSLAAPGKLLCEEVPGSLRNVAILYGEAWLWDAYAQLSYSIENVTPAFDHAHGVGLYEYLNQNLPAGEKFNKAMTAFSDHEAEAIKKAYNFSSAKTVVDIGGGQGHFVLSLLKTHPHLAGVVFDLPLVINSVNNVTVDDRMSYVSGDFFHEVYGGGDVYILKSVLHNWDDQACVTILQNCYKVMKPAARLLIIERVIPLGNEKSEAILFDINMLVMTEGQERTEAAYRRLLDASGFILHQIVCTESAVSILECFRKI
jgi:ubiquinone/menaquinone biosynthesis C-methylase UbiE